MMPPMPFKKSTYSAVLNDEPNEENDKNFDFEQAQESYKRPSARLRNFAFLAIPTLISVGTVFALLFLANSIKASSSAANAPHSPKPAGNGEPFCNTDSASSIQTTTYQPTSSSSSYIHSCGHTAAEARARGCIFDTISFSWLAPDCYDAELVEEFSHLKVPFPFFADPEGKVELPWSEVEKGERAMFVPWSHHLWHCGFLWRKMHRAIMAGKPVDSYIGGYQHTEHCTHIMVEENAQHNMEEVNTIMALKFPYCGPGETQWTGGTNFTGHDSH